MLITCFYLIKSFLKKKTKRGLELVPLTHLLHDSLGKIFLTLYSIKWPNFIAWLPSLFEKLDNICKYMYYNYFFLVYDITKFETNLSSLIPPLSYTTKNVWINNLKTKTAYKMKQKVLFVIFKVLSLKWINQTFFGRPEFNLNMQFEESNRWRNFFPMLKFWLSSLLQS